MRPLPVVLAVVALSPVLAACGDDDGGSSSTASTGSSTSTTGGTSTTGAGTTAGGTSTATGGAGPTTTATTGGTAAGDDELEDRYIAQTEVACAKVLRTKDAATEAAQALRGGATRARLSAFGAAYADYFVDSSAAIDLLADEDAPSSYDGFRRGTRAQADVIDPVFQRLARQARGVRSADDIRAIVDALPPVLKRLPKGPNPPIAFVRRAPSCLKVAQQGGS